MIDTLLTVPSTVSVDTLAASGKILLIHVDDDLESGVLLLSPQTAARLGQMLITAANRMQPSP